MGPVEMMLLRATGLLVIVSIPVAVYALLGALGRLSEAVGVICLVPAVEEAVSDVSSEAAGGIVAVRAPEPSRRSFYDQAIIDTYDEVILEGHPPGADDTLWIVAARTGARFGVVKAMVERQV